MRELLLTIWGLIQSHIQVLTQVAMIDNTFKKELGVTTNQFTDYPGGDEALKTKCEKAGAILNSQADQIKGTYVYTVSKYSSKGSTTIYSWGNLK